MWKIDWGRGFGKPLQLGEQYGNFAQYVIQYIENGEEKYITDQEEAINCLTQRKEDQEKRCNPEGFTMYGANMDGDVFERIGRNSFGDTKRFVTNQGIREYWQRAIQRRINRKGEYIARFG